MRNVRSVVFDLDGTLIDSAPDLRRAVNRLLAAESRSILDLDAVVGMIGDGAQKLVERAFEATGGLDDAHDLDDLTARFLGFYEGRATEMTHPYPGVVETLQWLQSEGLSLGICTNKPEAPTREILRDLSLDTYFDAVFGGDTLDGVKKPDPRLLQAVLDALHCDARATVMVGDNANDVAVARAAGVPIILRAGGYTRIPAADLGADQVIATFADLPAALARLRQDA